nr:hypothetical protein [Erwinia amylovora]
MCHAFNIHISDTKIALRNSL